jgi:cation diffusion facilitator family transporter
VHRGKETSSIALVASGKHMLTDSYTSFGVVLGLALVVATGIGAMDPLVAIAVASNILYSGYKLVRTSVGGLMDEADAETLEHLGGLIDKERKPEWISIHHLRALRSGDHHHIDFHLTIPFYWSVEQGHQFQQHVGNLIAAGLPQKSSVMIHVDPCAPDYCRFCRVNPCTERKSHFVHDLRWDVRTLTGNPPIFDPDEQ